MTVHSRACLKRVKLSVHTISLQINKHLSSTEGRRLWAESHQ